MVNENSSKSHFRIEGGYLSLRGKPAFRLFIQDETTLEWFKVPFDLYRKDLDDLVNVLRSITG